MKYLAIIFCVVGMFDCACAMERKVAYAVGIEVNKSGGPYLDHESPEINDLVLVRQSKKEDSFKVGKVAKIDYNMFYMVVTQIDDSNKMRGGSYVPKSCIHKLPQQ